MLQRQTNSHLLAFLILSQDVTYGKIFLQFSRHIQGDALSNGELEWIPHDESLHTTIITIQFCCLHQYVSPCHC